MTADDYWLVEVKDVGDPTLGILPYTRRYRFEGEDAAERAWDCYSKATIHKFKASAEHVRPVKVPV